jgi:ketosteroid isomerase-like protein
VSVDGLARQVETMWMAYSAAGLEAFLAHCDDDVEWSPHGADGRVLHGSDELRAFFAETSAAGERREPTIYTIEQHGDMVLLTGALRIVRRGQLTESQLAWIHQFRDGRLRSATSYATRAEALRAVAVVA